MTEAALFPPLMTQLLGKLKARKRPIQVVLALSSLYLAYKVTNRSLAPKQKSTKKANRVGVNKRFYQQISFILKICIPTWRSKTLGILVLHTLFLVLRTYLSVIVATLDGRLVKDLVINFRKKN